MPAGLPVHVNDVRLVGRLAAEATERIMPSGDKVVGFRLVVERAVKERRKGGPTMDALDCSAWASPQRRTALRWSPGDVVEVEGRLRRRFQRTPGGPVSRWEVEVMAATRLLRVSDVKAMRDCGVA